MDDAISRQAVLKLLSTMPPEEAITKAMLIQNVKYMSAAQPETHDKRTEIHACDCISRQAAIEKATKDHDFFRGATTPTDKARRDELLNVMCWLGELPSAQPERRCVNCGRTVNNGGWYEDGRTRCPIEEHYALPKDGYCHLWEKRKDWDDDYVKRAEEGEK